MGKGSKKHNNDLKKKARSRLEHLPQEALKFIADLPQEWIPDEVSNISKQGDDDPEGKKFVISFEYLKQSECRLGGFNPGKANALVHCLKKITDCEVRHRATLFRDKIDKTGPYKSLFNSLTPDVDLFEVQFADDGRIFFFHVAEEFYIVSIEDTHR